MRIVKISDDGTVTIELSTSEAAEVRDDLGSIPASRVTESGDRLHSLLECATSPQSTLTEREPS